MNLLSVTPRNERRLRLNFSNTVGSGAFGVLPSLYTLTRLDDVGGTILIKAALAVTGGPTNVELALGSDLVEGVLYSISCPNVPASDTSLTPNPTFERFLYGLTRLQINSEPRVSRRESLLYGTDLIWNGIDFQETGNGDLDRVSGTPCVAKNLYRATSMHGLGWDPSWGVNAREYVDSPISAAGNLKGAVAAQVLLDPRVRKVSTDVQTKGSDTFLVVTPTLVSGEAIQPVSIAVPNDA